MSDSESGSPDAHRHDDHDDHDRELIETLRTAQRFGFFGQRPIPEVVEHARHFVRALEGVTGAVVDLGSGGGAPGLVVAWDRPDLDVVLVDRRSKRTDFLSRAIGRLGLGDRVSVRCEDVAVTCATFAGQFDAVTARGFGPPDVTLRFADALCRSTGRIVISEPPGGDRWSPRLLDELDLIRRRSGAVAVFTAAS